MSDIAAHGAGHDAHPPGFAHQFEDVQQQRDAGRLGMWVFLVTEILFFGGMFTSYTIYRELHLSAFITGSHLLDVKFGATNTAVLICSSLTMALAIRSAQTGKKPRHHYLLADSHHDSGRCLRGSEIALRVVSRFHRGNRSGS